MTTEAQQAADRLSKAVPYLKLGIEKAERENPGARIRLAVVVESPDGSGKIAFKLDHADLLKDIWLVVGGDEPGPEHDAAIFAQRLRAAGVKFPGDSDEV